MSEYDEREVEDWDFVLPEYHTGPTRIFRMCPDPGAHEQLAKMTRQFMEADAECGRHVENTERLGREINRLTREREEALAEVKRITDASWTFVGEMAETARVERDRLKAKLAEVRKVASDD